MCICAGFTTPLEGVTIYTPTGAPELPSLRSFLESRGVLYDLHVCSPEEMQSRFAQGHRPVVVIGARHITGFDPEMLVRALP